jgi:calcium-dependent protein kinase
MKDFFAEMTMLSKLSHPSIVTLYNLFHYEKKYYVVMEYCNGSSVIEMINKITPKSEKIVINIMKQLLRALSYMHSLNIVHRDIKLENIVFLHSADLSQAYIPIKIIDFGSAVKMQYKVVQNYPVAGTLTHLAPEVMKGILTEKSDVWSSAVLMYILLTGVSPFKGNTEF